MENKRTNGQYGKRNPLFMYQGAAGYSVRAALKTAVRRSREAQIITAEPFQSGNLRCGALQNQGKE